MTPSENSTNGGIPLNRLKYLAEQQAVTVDQVLYNLSIRNRLLICWSRVHDHSNDVELLNQAIPNETIKVNICSERMKKRLKWHCWRAHTVTTSFGLSDFSLDDVVFYTRPMKSKNYVGLTGRLQKPLKPDSAPRCPRIVHMRKTEMLCVVTYVRP